MKKIDVEKLRDWITQYLAWMDENELTQSDEFIGFLDDLYNRKLDQFAEDDKCKECPKCGNSNLQPLYFCQQCDTTIDFSSRSYGSGTNLKTCESDKCEECGGSRVDKNDFSYIKHGGSSLRSCPSCHGSGTLSNSVKLLDEDDRNSIPVMDSIGTKLDPVLYMLDKIKIGLDEKWKEILKKAQDLTFDNFRGEGLSMALDVVKELEQKRKEELGK